LQYYIDETGVAKIEEPDTNFVALDPTNDMVNSVSREN
jgi:hypothetical protein